MKSKPHPIGTVFIIPLRDSGYGIGLLTRSTGKGTCFGYFFGPRVFSIDEVDFRNLSPSSAVLVGMFGDLDLLRGNWPIVGKMVDWFPDQWPVPKLARVDEKANQAWLSTYDDSLCYVKEMEISPKEAAKYPYDRMMGSGAVEIRLTKLLISPAKSKDCAGS